MTEDSHRADRAPIELHERRHAIDQRKMVLMQRLDDGYFRIEMALNNGDDIAAWEAFWIDLLHEYEGLCQSLDRAA